MSADVPRAVSRSAQTCGVLTTPGGMREGRGTGMMYAKRPGRRERFRGAMVRRVCIAGLIAGVVALGACSGSGAKTTASTTPTTTPTSAHNGSGSFCDTARSHQPAPAPGKAANPLTDPSALRQELETVRSAAAAGPPAIRRDLDALVDYYTRLVQASERARGNPRALAAALRGFESDRTTITAAARRITAYIEQNCRTSGTTG